jgi:hypothetical protein
VVKSSPYLNAGYFGNFKKPSKRKYVITKMGKKSPNLVTLKSTEIMYLGKSSVIFRDAQ